MKTPGLRVQVGKSARGLPAHDFFRCVRLNRWPICECRIRTLTAWFINRGVKRLIRLSTSTTEQTTGARDPRPEGLLVVDGAKGGHDQSAKKSALVESMAEV